MFNLFKKGKKCAICGASNKTSKIICYDPTNRGKIPELGVKQYLCLTHLPDIWIPGMDNYNGFSICYLPQKGWNSYSYTTLDRAKYWALSKKEIGVLDGLINEHNDNASCSQCSKKAVFLLYNNIYGAEASPEPPKLLCGEHFVKRIIQEIQSKNLSIDEINIPFGDKGLYMHGEY